MLVRDWPLLQWDDCFECRWPVARGQFFDRHGEVKEALAAEFLACLSQQLDLAGVANCFPFQVLRLEAPIEHFYQFYGI